MLRCAMLVVWHCGGDIFMVYQEPKQPARLEILVVRAEGNGERKKTRRRRRSGLKMKSFTMFVFAEADEK